MPIRSSFRLAACLVLSVCLTVAHQAQETTVGREADVPAPLRDRAVQVILDASRSENPRLRLVALESVSVSPERARPMAQLALGDQNPAVRYGALVTIGRLQLNGLGLAAAEMADDPNPSVRAAALFAAHRCGQSVDLTPLAQMLGSSDLEIRGNAAMLLGLLGDPGAKPMLQEMASMPVARVDPAKLEWVRLQFAEAIIRLDPDDDRVMQAVRASVYSQYDDIRVLGLQIVGEVGDRTMDRWLLDLLKPDNPIQVRIAAAAALAQGGLANGRDTLVAASAYTEAQVNRDVRRFLSANRGGDGPAYEDMVQLSSDAQSRRQVAGEVRAQAAFGLGNLGDLPAVQRLEQMLDDPEPITAVAAAGALLRVDAAGD
ncbi:MAG: HEAT repeat domain-containing protein [Planctomycetota bacterium]